jgi:hypothetical protein
MVMDTPWSFLLTMIPVLSLPPVAVDDRACSPLMGWEVIGLDCELLQVK